MVTRWYNSFRPPGPWGARQQRSTLRRRRYRVLPTAPIATLLCADIRTAMTKATSGVARTLLATGQLMTRYQEAAGRTAATAIGWPPGKRPEALSTGNAVTRNVRGSGCQVLNRSGHARTDGLMLLIASIIASKGSFRLGAGSDRQS